MLERKMRIMRWTEGYMVKAILGAKHKQMKRVKGLMLVSAIDCSNISLGCDKQ